MWDNDAVVRGNVEPLLLAKTVAVELSLPPAPRPPPLALGTYNWRMQIPSSE
jgi:hypothetical protein